MRQSVPKTRVRPLLLACAILAAAALGAGCAGNGVKSQSYANDGYMGRTNSYPGIPERHMARNYQSDADMMKQAIRNVPGVAGSNVTFNGAEAYVTIKVAAGMAMREIPTVERQAASVLRFNFPRYNIHVSTMKP